MNEYKSSKYNYLKNSYNYKNLSNKLKKNKSLYPNSYEDKKSRQNISYFKIYRQIKEEMKMNDSFQSTKNNLNDQKRKNKKDELYLESTNKIDDYIKNNYSFKISLETKELDNIYKKDFPLEVENNQNYFKYIIPQLKYKNHPKSKQISISPAPNTDNMNDFQKNTLKSKPIKKKNSLEKSNEGKIITEKEVYDLWSEVYKVENNDYTNEINKNNKDYYCLEKLNKNDMNQNIIQNKNNKNNFNQKNNDDILSMNITENKIEDEQNTKEIQNKNGYNKNQSKDPNSISNEISININNKKNLVIFDETKTKYDDLVQVNILAGPKTYNFKPENNLSFNYSGHNIRNQNRNQTFKELSPIKNDYFKIINEYNNTNLTQGNYLYIQFKPIINICYLSKDKIGFLNNSDDLNKIKLIQNKTKIFLRNKNNQINNNLKDSLKDNTSSYISSHKYSLNNNNNNIKSSINSSLKPLSKYYNIDNNDKKESSNNNNIKKSLNSSLRTLSNYHNIDNYDKKEISNNNNFKKSLNSSLRTLSNYYNIDNNDKKDSLNNNIFKKSLISSLRTLSNHYNINNNDENLNNNNFKKRLNTSLKTLSNYYNINNNDSESQSDGYGNDIKNNSENKPYTRNRIISQVDSLQFFHNLTINKEGQQFFDNLIGNNEDSSNNEGDSNNNDVLKHKNSSFSNSKISISLSNSINKLEKNNNLKNKNEHNLLIEKEYITLKGQENNKNKNIIKDNKNYYFEKIIYTNLEDTIFKIKGLQSKISIYLHRKYINNNIYDDSSSSNENKYNTDKNSDIINEKNILEVKQNIDLNQTQDKSNNNNEKLKLLKKLIMKNNRQLNKELKDNINEYYIKNNKVNQLLFISKKKLPLKLMKIVQHHLKTVFNNLYQYKTLETKRKIILLKLFNKINSKLRRYFCIWAQRPLKLLIYKSKNCKYNHSLYLLKNKIKQLIHAIFKVYSKKYFFELIIYYLNTYNIDINNNQILYFLTKENENNNIISFILKQNNNFENINDKNKLKDYLNIIDRLNTNDNIDIINSNNINDKKKNEYRNKPSRFKIVNDLGTYKKVYTKSYTPIKARNIGIKKDKKKS